jgi:hypothetical protein
MDLPLQPMNQKKKKIPAWRVSKAKDKLYKDIVKGDVNEDMEPHIVYGMRVEYQEYKYENFKTNLANLLRTTRKHQGRANRDAEIVAHDLNIRPPIEGLVWHGSNAEELLKQDFEQGLTEDGRTPKELHDSRPEYKQFTLAVFRRHLYHERLTTKRLYWMAVKNRYPNGDDTDDDN